VRSVFSRTVSTAWQPLYGPPGPTDRRATSVDESKLLELQYLLNNLEIAVSGELDDGDNETITEARADIINLFITVSETT
jgi:hypothetical protein